MLNRLLGLLLWAFLTIYPTGAFAEGDEDTEDEEDEEEEESEDSDSEEDEEEEEKEDEDEEDEFGDDLTVEKAKEIILAQQDRAKKLAVARKPDQKELEKLRAEQKKREDSKKDKIVLATDERDLAVSESKVLKQQLEDTRIKNAIEIRAARMGFVDPSDAYSLVGLDTDDSEIEYDAKSGKVTGVEKALKALAKEKPYLVNESEDDRSGRGKGTPSRKKITKVGKRGAGESEERAAETVAKRL